MKSVREVVLEQHTSLMKNRGMDEESREDMKFGRDFAIDSLGIVELILGIEEELDVELDECLAVIRKCRTIGDMIEVIEKYVNQIECNSKNT